MVLTRGSLEDAAILLLNVFAVMLIKMAERMRLSIDFEGGVQRVYRVCAHSFVYMYVYASVHVCACVRNIIFQLRRTHQTVRLYRMRCSPVL